MRYLIWIECLKLFKRKFFCLAVFLAAIIGPFLMGLYTKALFVSQYSNWSRLSRDPNPYNFLLNKASWYTGVSTLLCLVLWGYVITSTEYKERTIDRIQISPKGLRKIFFVKTLLMFFIGVVSLAISLTTIYILFKPLPVQYVTKFTGYTFPNKQNVLAFVVLLCLCILKIAAFHHVLIAIAKRHYYVPLIIGSLCIFFFPFNLLPYGIYYRTYQGATLFKLVVVNNFIGFSLVMILYFIFFNEKIQKRLKKMQRSI